AAIAAQTPGQPSVVARPSRCVGRARCFFCRERRTLDSGAAGAAVAGVAWELAPAVLADESSCFESSESQAAGKALEPARGTGDVRAARPFGGGTERSATPRRVVVRRKSARERGQPVFKPRVHAVPLVATTDNTWYAKHTVAPIVSHGVADATAQAVTFSISDLRNGPPSGEAAHEAASPQPYSSKVLEATSQPKELAPKMMSASAAPTAEAAFELWPAAAAPVKGAVNAAELEPYTSAAARFRAEFDFVDTGSSWPGSPTGKLSKGNSFKMTPPSRSVPSRFMPFTSTAPLPVAVEADGVPPPPPPPPPTNTFPLPGSSRLPELPKTSAVAEKTSALATFRWKQLLSRVQNRGSAQMAAWQGWVDLLKQRRAAVHQPVGAAVAAVGAVHQPAVVQLRRGASVTGSLVGSPAGTVRPPARVGPKTLAGATLWGSALAAAGS
ncbi:unnamed protein product, partial [Polarella glacialis]